MSNYTQTTFFTPKDSLPPSDPGKTIFGAAYDVEFGNIATAISSKFDSTTIAAAPVQFNIGTAALPGITFVGHTGTGLFSNAGGDLGLSANGTQRLIITAASGLVTASSGLTVSGAAFTSRGILDNATATALTIASTGASTFAPTSGIPLTLAGLAATITLAVTSGNTTPVADVLISRPSTTINTLALGANIELQDVAGGTDSILQHAGGQTELWQFNVSWNQILKVLTTRGVVINAPASGVALAVVGVAGSSVFASTITSPNTASTSNGLRIFAGTNTADLAFVVTNAASSLNFLQIDGAGSLWTSGATGGAQGVGTINTTGLAINAQPVYAGIPTNVQSGASYTLVLADANKFINTSFSGAKTLTIPANGSVAFPVGTAVTFTNTNTGNLTIAITTDTLVWSTNNTTGSRTLAAGGMATALKTAATQWFISGAGIS